MKPAQKRGLFLFGGECIEDITLWQGDCLELMKKIPDKSVDMILCDLPYGTTACKWDVVIPFEPLWQQYKRIIKNNSGIVLFGSEPFSSKLRMSNLKMYKYDWVWEKEQGSNFLNCRTQPYRVHENILVFSVGKCLYNPQMTKGKPYVSGKGDSGEVTGKVKKHKLEIQAHAILEVYRNSQQKNEAQYILHKNLLLCLSI